MVTEYTGALAPLASEYTGALAPLDGEKPVQSSAARRYVADPMISAVKGAIGVPEFVLGIADLFTGGHAGKLAEDAGFRAKDARAILDEYLSPEQQAVNKGLQDTKGFLPTIGYAVTNPSTMVHGAIESVPSMLGGGVIARGALAAAPKMSPMIAGALGEGVASAGSTAEQIRQETANGLLTGEQAAIAGGSGVLTGALGAAGARMAKALGITDIDTAIASGKLAESSKGLLRRIGEGTLSEGLLEELPQSAQEQVAQNLALGRKWNDGVAEAAAMGMLVGGMIGGGAAAFSRQPEELPPPKPTDPLLPETHNEILGKAAGLVRKQNSAPDLTATEAPAKPVNIEWPERAALNILLRGNGLELDAGHQQELMKRGLAEQTPDGNLSASTAGRRRWLALEGMPDDTQGGLPNRGGTGINFGAVLGESPAGTELPPEQYAMAEQERINELLAKQPFERTATDLIQLRDYQRKERERPTPKLEVPYDVRTVDISTHEGAINRALELSQQVLATPIDEAAHTAATSPQNELPEPTEKQKEAGNYKKGHINVGGLDVSVENPAGSKRRPEWPTLESHYGYVKGVPARAPDKEHVDVFVKPGTTEAFNGPVFVVDQNHADGKFDEPKVMTGYATQDEALAAYLKNYTPGWESRVHGVAAIPMDEFKRRLNMPEAFMKPQPDSRPLTRRTAQDAKPLSPKAAITQMEAETAAVLKGPKAPGIMGTIASAQGQFEREAEAAAKAQTPVSMKSPERPAPVAAPESAPVGAPGPGRKPAQPPTFTPEELAKIGGRDVKGIALPRLRRLAKRGGDRVRAAAEAEIARREAARQAVRQAREDAKNDPSRKFLAAVSSLGGVKSDGVLGGALDILGDRNAVRGKAGRIFKKDGRGLDQLATLLHERNWLTDEEYGDVDGGVQRVKDMIRDAVNGELGPVLEEDIAYAGMRAMEEQGLREAARAEGIDLTDGDVAVAMDVADAVEQDYAEYQAFKAQNIEAEDADAEAALREFLNDDQRQDEVVDEAGREDRLGATGEKETSQAEPAAEAAAEEVATPGKETFEAYLARLKAEQQRRVEAIGEVGDIAVVRHTDPKRGWQAILENASGEGGWRTQSFDENGFSGHALYKTKQEAIEEAARDGFITRDDGALDRLQDTPGFKRGLAVADIIRKLNAKEIDYAQANEQIAALGPAAKKGESQPAQEVAQPEAERPAAEAGQNESDNISAARKELESGGAGPVYTGIVDALRDRDNARRPGLLKALWPEITNLPNPPANQWQSDIWIEANRPGEIGLARINFPELSSRIRAFGDVGIEPERPALALESQSPAELAAKSARESDEATAQKSIIDREAESAPFALQTQSKPVEAASADNKARQTDIFSAKPESPTGNTDATLARFRPRQMVVFGKPYVGKTGAKLTGYEWKWRPEAIVDNRGEDRTIRISDWDEAITNPATNRDIVHQFQVETTDGRVELVSAETAATMLGVSDSTARGAAKRLLEQEMAKRESADKLEKYKEGLDAKEWFKTPAAAVDGLIPGLRKVWSKYSAWGEAKREADAGDYTAENRWKSMRDTKIWFLKGPNGYLAIEDAADEGRGWSRIELTPQQIWDAQGKDAQVQPAAPANPLAAVADALSTAADAIRKATAPETPKTDQKAADKEGVVDQPTGKKVFTFAIKPEGDGFVIESDNGGGIVVTSGNGFGMLYNAPARIFKTRERALEYMREKGMKLAEAAAQAAPMGGAEGAGSTAAQSGDTGAADTQESAQGVPLGIEGARNLVRSATFVKHLDDLLKIPLDAQTVRPSANAVDGAATSREGGVNRVRSDAQALRDIIQKHTFAQEPFSSLDAETKRLVLTHMLSLGHDRQVLDSVVKFIPIDVMNNLVGPKFSPDVLFKNRAMLQRALSVGLGPRVTLSGDFADTLIRAIALAGAEVSSGRVVADLMGPSLKTGSAGGAFDGNHGNNNTRNDGVTQREPPSRTAMFSRASESGDFVTEAWTMLAKNDDVFQQPKLDDKNIDIIARKVDSAIKLFRYPKPVTPGASKQWVFTMPDGKTADVTQYKAGGLVLNASRLEEGGGGSKLYGILSTYAHNNGLQFIGDPDGLSDAALYRRTENMISTALKFGTTKHIYPGERQILEGLDWQEGDTTGNLRNMLQFSYDLIAKNVPEIGGLEYNFDTRQFEKAPDGTDAGTDQGTAAGDGIQADQDRQGAAVQDGTGQADRVGPMGPVGAEQRRVFSDAKFKDLADTPGAREARAGVATLKRAAFTNTLLRELRRPGRIATAGGREGILGSLVRQSSDGVDPALQRIAYSKSTTNRAGSVDRARLESLVTRLRAGWRNAPRIIVHNSIYDASVPEAILDEDVRQRSQGAKGNVEGVWYDGEVHLFSDSIPSLDRAVTVVFHETLGHYGLRGAFGDRLTPILKQIAGGRRGEVERKGINYGLVERDENKKVVYRNGRVVWKGDGEMIAAEEVLAELAQSRPEIGFVKRAIAAIREFLRSIGVDLKLSDNDIIANFILPARAYVERGGETQAMSPQLAYSKPAEPFYSALAVEVGNLKTNAAPAAGWKSAIKGMIGKGAVKSAEVEATGLNEWLDLQQGKVTKDQVMQFLNENGVQVRDVVMGDSSGAVPLTDAELAEYERLGEMTPEDMTPEEREIYGQLDRRQMIRYNMGQPEGMTKFSQYQLPGGENYRELLLTLPTDATRLRAEGDRISRLENPTQDEIEIFRRANVAGGSEFRSSHFDQPNILAHVRFNERTDADGGRVLFIEEIQSDWAQKGKKEGFSGKNAGAVDDIVANAVRENRELTPAERARVDAIMASGEGSNGNVPSAPFVTKTEAWTALALKRMIRYAAENGFDRVAWTTGEQQAARYDLSKHIDSIDVRKIDNGKLMVYANKNNEQVLTKMTTPDALDEVIGKDMARRVLDDIAAGRPTQYRGIDLKTGGEGMLAFYNRIVPNVANDVLKKMGGGRVGTVAISLDGEFNQAAPAIDPTEHAREVTEALEAGVLSAQPGFDITPSLRDRALQGTPMFERQPRQPQTDTPEFRRWFEGSAVTGADGKPLRVLHATDADVDAFDTGEGRAPFTTSPDALGSWFAEDPALSNRIHQIRGEESDYAGKPYAGRTYVAYLAIKNPLKVESRAKLDGMVGPGKTAADLKKSLVAKGYDGIVIENDYGMGRSFVAFNAGQVKSATGNSGAFDAGNPDIRFSRTGGGKFIEVRKERYAERRGDTGPFHDVWRIYDKTTGEKLSSVDYSSEAAARSAAKGIAAPDIRFSRTPEWVSTGPAALQSAASKIDTFAPEQTIAQKVKGLTTDWQKRLVQGVFDAYAPLKELSNKAYILARMTKSADGVLEGMLMYGKPKMDADGAIVGDLDGKGFLGAMQELKGEHDRFFMWVAGNRASRLAAEGRENLFGADEIQAMKVLNRGQMKDGSSRESAYLRGLQALSDYNKAVMDIAEKTGLIDGAARHLWEHDFYIPFYRVMEDDKLSGPGKIKGLVRQQAFKKLKGGQENLGDLMANTLRNWSHLLSASLANQAAVHSLEAAERIGAATQVPADTKGATFAMVNGKQVHYEVDDPFVLQAISAIESVTFKGLPMKLMGKFKHYLTLGVTASPTFRIRNLMRDTLAAISQNDISYNALNNVVEGFKGTDKKSADYANMLFGGGMMRFGTYLEGDRAEHVRRLIDAGVDDSTILNTRQKVKAALAKLWDGYQDFGDRMENINRTALYKQLIAQGKTHLEASYAARDAMDFSLQGSWVAMRFLNQVVPFLNARAQGLYKLGRAAKHDPKRMAYVVGAISLASIALLLAYSDDDDWKVREDWDRDAFWWFKIGETAYRIPKPFEVGAMGTLAERGVELMIADEMTGKRFGERMKSMLTNTFALNPVPQLFKPMLDIYSNVDSFTGRQIETRGMERLSKPERETASTSLVARALGAAGDVTGLSPIQVDHLIRGYFGWLGSHAAMTVDLMAQPFREGERPTQRLNDMLVVGDFAKNLPADQSRYVEEFYKQAKAVSEVMADIKHAREIGEIDRAKEIMEENKDKVALYRLFTRAEKKMGEINKSIRMTQINKGLSGDEKRARLDQLTAMRNQLAKTVNDRAIALR